MTMPTRQRYQLLRLRKWLLRLQPLHGHLLQLKIEGHHGLLTSPTDKKAMKFFLVTPILRRMVPAALAGGHLPTWKSLFNADFVATITVRNATGPTMTAAESAMNKSSRRTWTTTSSSVQNVVKKKQNSQDAATHATGIGGRPSKSGRIQPS